MISIRDVAKHLKWVEVNTKLNWNNGIRKAMKRNIKRLMKNVAQKNTKPKMIHLF